MIRATESKRIQPHGQDRSQEVDGRMHLDLGRRPAPPAKRGATTTLTSVLLACWLLTGPATAASVKTPKQRLFATPEAAVQALVEATKAADQNEMSAIYGPERDRLLSGDAVLDANSLKRFAEHLGTAAILNKVDDTRYTLLVGENHWPSPIPIVKEGRKWRFDTAAGLDEILNRKIGQNELSAIMACRAYVLAQWEYFTEARNTSRDGLAVYAQHLISTPGERDGLYWDAPEDGKPSPLGSLVAAAREEGYSLGLAKSAGAPKRSPFHGYFFRILKAQGPHAPGGKFDFVINGNMIAGYALIAYPDRWGSSGVMTFIVNQQGRVYEKDLGPETADLAQAVVEYDPDPTWKLVVEEP
ncbi:MAG TPA: DUF2950 domain-containing protein [Thermoanaerobaculaceae bacterium]|nr:DUF2950 domain-containing protein [Thermoanaerobaculaceae bacterium]HPS76661.1 DUF2950 domain-containing protein [Thermoanaerobaculaceae bacterium]